MDQSVEDRFHGQSHRSNEQGDWVQDAHPLKGEDRGNQERNQDVVFEPEI